MRDAPWQGQLIFTAMGTICREILARRSIEEKRRGEIEVEQERGIR